jgi:hypothetical protein
MLRRSSETMPDRLRLMSNGRQSGFRFRQSAFPAPWRSAGCSVAGRLLTAWSSPSDLRDFALQGMRSTRGWKSMERRSLATCLVLGSKLYVLALELSWGARIAPTDRFGCKFVRNQTSVMLRHRAQKRARAGAINDQGQHRAEGVDQAPDQAPRRVEGRCRGTDPPSSGLKRQELTSYELAGGSESQHLARRHVASRLCELQ